MTKTWKQLLGLGKKKSPSLPPTINIKNILEAPDEGASSVPEPIQSLVSKIVKDHAQREMDLMDRITKSRHTTGGFVNNLPMEESSERVLPLVRNVMGNLGMVHTGTTSSRLTSKPYVKDTIVNLDGRDFDITRLSDYLMMHEDIKLHPQVTFIKENTTVTTFTRCGLCMKELEPIVHGDESNYTFKVRSKSKVIGVIKVCPVCLTKVTMMGKVKDKAPVDLLYGKDGHTIRDQVLDFIQDGLVTNLQYEQQYDGVLKVNVEIMVHR